MKRFRRSLAVSVLCALSLASCQRDGGAKFQGWVEADTVFIGAEDAGRVASLPVAEGDSVTAGQILFGIDSATQTADVEGARGALAEAKSRLARAEAALQRPEEIAVLQATQRKAEAALEFSSADLTRTRELVAKGIAARSRLDQAQSAFDRDKAALDEVRRQIELGHLGGRREDLDALRSLVAQAEARLAAAEARRARLSVNAPVAGRIEQIYYRVGEVVPQGRPVIALLPPENVKLRFFVPQAALPKLKTGDRVGVACDGCASGLEAIVIFIAAQAEFTPPVIYSLEERRKLVFKVEARPLKPEAFRVGQPVVVLAPGG